jgi:hypothetical protein
MAISPLSRPIPQPLDRQRQEADAHLLPRRQDHIQLPLVGPLRHLLGKPDQSVRFTRHGGDDHDHVVARRPRLGDTPGDVLDPIHVPDGGASVLLHNQRH